MPEKNPHAGHRKRMLEKYHAEGESAFYDHELLEMLLYYSIPQDNTNGIAHELLQYFNNTHDLFLAARGDYKHIKGIGDKSATLLSLVGDIIQRSQRQEDTAITKVSTVSQSFAYCRKLFVNVRYERLYMLCMDTNNQVRHVCMLGEGTLDQIPVYTRKVVEQAIAHSAFQVMLTHNHPQGKSEPSDGDVDVTYAIAHALATIEVPVVDHIIVGEKSELSFLREGIMPQVMNTVAYSLNQREINLKKH